MAIGRRTQAFAFSQEQDLDRTLLANRRSFGIDYTGGSRPGGFRGRAFAKVLELRADTDDKIARCEEVVCDASTGDFATPEGNAWQFDSDNLSNDVTTTDVYSMVALEEDEVVEIELYPDKSGDYEWLAIKQAAASTAVLLNLKSLASGVFTCDIINPTDDTVITSDVSAKAIDTAANEDDLVGNKYVSSLTAKEDLGGGEETVYYFNPPILF